MHVARERQPFFLSLKWLRRASRRRSKPPKAEKKTIFKQKTCEAQGIRGGPRLPPAPVLKSLWPPTEWAQECLRRWNATCRNPKTITRFCPGKPLSWANKKHPKTPVSACGIPPARALLRTGPCWGGVGALRVQRTGPASHLQIP